MPTSTVRPDIPLHVPTKTQVTPSAGFVHTAGAVRIDPALGHVDVLQLATGVARAALAAEVVEVQHVELALLAALHAEVGDGAAGRGRDDGGQHAAEVEVGVVELLEVGGREGVDRVAVGAGAVGVHGQHGVAPVVVGRVEVGVAGREVDAVVGRVVDRCRAGPTRRR